MGRDKGVFLCLDNRQKFMPVDTAGSSFVYPTVFLPGPILAWEDGVLNGPYNETFHHSRGSDPLKFVSDPLVRQDPYNISFKLVTYQLTLLTPLSISVKKYGPHGE